MKRVLKLLSVLLVLKSIQPRDGVPPEVLRVIEEQENIVERLAEEVADLFEKRGKHLVQCECSVHSCTNQVSGSKCTEGLGNVKDICGEDCEGRLIDFGRSYFRVPPNTQLNGLSHRLKESICLYANLEPVMKELVNETSPEWIFFGGVDGMMRSYPGSNRRQGLASEDDELQGCRPFEPRIRPWFIAASTGPKDIVFVIDISRSMNEPAMRFTDDSRWDVTKRALISMVDTLASFDFVNIVTFSDSADRLVKDGSLLSGTNANRAFLKKALDDIFPVGTTNFEAGFKEAFDILTHACDEDPERQGCSNCRKVIFFLTDGKDTSKDKGASIKATHMLHEIEHYQRKLFDETGSRAQIFTFSMGDNSDDSIPRQIACANEGAWSYIGAGMDALTAMNSYYRFLTDPATSSRTVWLEPYEDHGGLGNITTVARPVYSKGTQDLDGVFLGVAAHDVLLSELEISGLSYMDVLHELISRVPTCGKQPQTECQLQVHRDAYLDNSVCVDPVTSSWTGKAKSSSRESTCYKGLNKYYKFFPTTRSWKAAERLCRRDKGRLTVIENDEELAFVAGLSSSDGSWIGAKRSTKTLRMEWIDKKASRANLESSSYWGVGEPNNEKYIEDCVSIDRRGILGNLNDVRCDKELSFICEYPDSARCDKTIEVPEKGYFNVPPPHACAHEEASIRHVRPHRLARRSSREDIVCPFGKPKPAFDLICCPGCDNE